MGGVYPLIFLFITRKIVVDNIPKKVYNIKYGKEKIKKL